MNNFTYEVITYNNKNEETGKKSFNTHLESRIYFDICKEKNDSYYVNQVKITNHKDRSIIREHYKN